MEFIKHILSRGLPKTGQDTVYAVGDDGTYQAGWWLKRTIANNRSRFIAKTIGGDVVVFDRATGLCWAGDGNEAGGNSGAAIMWANALAYALALDFAGFTDWRIPNIIELRSITNFGLSAPAIAEPPFSNTISGYYWSSTTRNDLTTSAWAISFTAGVDATLDKTSSKNLRCVCKGL